MLGSTDGNPLLRADSFGILSGHIRLHKNPDFERIPDKLFEFLKLQTFAVVDLVSKFREIIDVTRSQ